MKRSLFSIANLEYWSSFGVPKMKPNVFHQDWINLPCPLFFFPGAVCFGMAPGVKSLESSPTPCTSSFSHIEVLFVIRTASKDFPVIQRLKLHAPNARGPGFHPWGLRFHPRFHPYPGPTPRPGMPLLRTCTWQQRSHVSQLRPGAAK